MVGDRFGFLTLRRRKSGVKRNPIRNLFPIFVPNSTSVPTLTVSTVSVDSGTSDPLPDSGTTLSILNTTMEDTKPKSDDSGIAMNKTKSNLDLLVRTTYKSSSTMIHRSQSSRRVSRSVANLISIYRQEEVRSVDFSNDVTNCYIKTENLAATTTTPETATINVETSKEKQMSIGRKKFNIDPKKGLEYLIENSLLNHTVKDIAHFLNTGEGLNKSQIGNYLGEYREFNQQVLTEFINLQDFKDLVVIQALRQFLWAFHPPGEAQKIERMLEGFAKRYCHQNPTTFTDSDVCFTLAYCIVILNTVLHNKNVKEKFPVQVFIDMINNPEGIRNPPPPEKIPVPLLEKIFEEILLEPFKTDDGDDLMHTYFNPDREGWLWKQGGRYKSWKRRWFIMTGNCLYYFEFTTDKVFRGNIPLENIKVRDVEDKSMPNCFEIFSDNASIIKACKTTGNGKLVEGRHHVYRFSATNAEEKQQWMDAVRKSNMLSPFYTLGLLPSNDKIVNQSMKHC